MAEQIPFVQSSYRSGMYDIPSLTLPLNYNELVENMVVDGDLMRSRGGYGDFANGYQYPGEIQAIHQFDDNDGNSHVVVASEGRIFRYDFDDSDPTEVTNGLTFSTSQDARFVFQNWDGGCYLTDGVNPMAYLPDGSTALVLFNTLGPEVPSQAGAFEVFENSFWWGDFTDFDPDQTRRRYGTIHSMITSPGLYREDLGARNDHNRAMTVQSLLKHGGDLLILMERAIRYATLDPSPLSLGSARTQYFYKDLTPEHEFRGLVAKLGAQRSRRGTFLIDRPGLHQIQEGNPPQKPRYISLPIERFWAGINQNRIQQSVCAALPERNGILFCVPHGTAQTRNNRGIFLNIEAWTDRGGDIEDVHPAFSIWKGDEDQPFEFNALATIVDRHTGSGLIGRQRCLGGTYGGKVMYLDEGTTDDGTDFTCRWITPRIGDPARIITWDEVFPEISLEAAKSVQIRQIHYGGGADSTQTATKEAAAVVLGMFLLGTSSLGGQTIGTLRRDLNGDSRYTQFEYTVLSGLPLTVYQQTVKGTPGPLIGA